MKQCLYLIFCLFCLCSCGSLSTIIGANNPQGSRETQIQYHKNEIKKYKALIGQEEQQSQRSLTRRDMLDVRKSNERKAKYLERIEEHTKALEQLQKAKNAPPAVSLISDDSEVDELKYINHQIQALTELKSYYISKSSRTRNRATRLQYQGLIDESEKMSKEADDYDDIVKKIDGELTSLEAQKAKLLGNTKVSRLSHV